MFYVVRDGLALCLCAHNNSTTPCGTVNLASRLLGALFSVSASLFQSFCKLPNLSHKMESSITSSIATMQVCRLTEVLQRDAARNDPIIFQEPPCFFKAVPIASHTRIKCMDNQEHYAASQCSRLSCSSGALVVAAARFSNTAVSKVKYSVAVPQRTLGLASRHIFDCCLHWQCS